MPRFIETSDGSQVLSSEIVSVQKLSIGKSVIKTRRNKLHVVKGMVLYDLMRIIEEDTSQFIPAAPGYSVVFLFSPNRRGQEWPTAIYPVVGWRIIESGCDLGPIYDSAPVVAGSHSISTRWGLMMLDGKIYSSRSDFPMRMDEWIQAEKEHYEAEDDYYPGEDDADNEGCNSDDDQETETDTTSK